MTHDEDELVEALGEICKSPFRLLHQVLTGVCVFGHFPKESVTKRNPPRQLDERSDSIPIDECLGLYRPDDQRIIIFLKGIKAAAGLLQVTWSHLHLIVGIHECAHAIIHLGVTDEERQRILQDDTCWKPLLVAGTRLFHDIEHDLHEILAQMLTLHCIRQLRQDSRTSLGKHALECVEHAFHRLACRQPKEYRIDGLLDVPADRLRKGIDLLRNRLLAPQSSAWRTVMTW